MNFCGFLFTPGILIHPTQAKFGLTTRRHHCRHCGRLLCSKCSAKEMPIIKYNLSKQVKLIIVKAKDPGIGFRALA